MKKYLLVFLCLFLVLLTGCNMIKHMNVPTKVIIEDITYKNGFYGELEPLFGQVGDIGNDTLQEEVIYDDGVRKFRRVDFDGNDWVHSYTGELSGGVVYCAEDQWEQMYDYYADPDNYEYYCGIEYYSFETSISIPDMDLVKFDELLAFGEENNYNPFDKKNNKKIMQKVQRIPLSEYNGCVGFYKVSKDGYFNTRAFRYFVYGGKLFMVFFYDGGRDEVVVVDVPDELGEYVISLIEQYGF